MNKIKQKTSLDIAAERDLTEYKPSIDVGDIFISDNGNLIKILKITKTKIITTSEYSDINDLESTTEHDKNKFPKSECRHTYLKLEKSADDYLKAGLDLLQHPEENEETEEISEETAITKGMNKSAIEAVKNEMVHKANQFEIIHRMLGAKLNQMQHYIRTQREQIEKVCRVIDVIELYLGVHEEIFQLQKGELAPTNELLCLRQMVLYMDEEAGITEGDGIDFKRIEEFDTWLLNRNIDKIIPEKKCIIALRIRRNSKDYGDIHDNVINNKYNMRTYILIRNGDNLYRIWAPLNIYPRLFPLKNEFKNNENEHGFHRYFNEEDLENAKFHYKKHALALQGIIDRSQILQPMKAGVSVFKPQTWKNNIRFIADEEAALPDGRKNWADWRKEINSTIDIGSRIYFCYRPTIDLYKELTHRVPYGYGHSHWPCKGLYKVERKREVREYCSKEKNIEFYFLYNPKDTIYTKDYNDWHHERKNRIRFHFYKDEVLNYDRISLDDIEFYLNSRVDRHNYLEMLPILRNMKKERLQEIEREKHLVTLIASKYKYSEKQIWEAIDWWKYKNIWKRPIDEDDAKALRMILRHLKRKDSK